MDLFKQFCSFAYSVFCLFGFHRIQNLQLMSFKMTYIISLDEFRMATKIVGFPFDTVYLEWNNKKSYFFAYQTSVRVISHASISTDEDISTVLSRTTHSLVYFHLFFAIPMDHRSFYCQFMWSNPIWNAWIAIEFCCEKCVSADSSHRHSVNIGLEAKERQRTWHK